MNPRLGIDVGSTTVKLAVYDIETRRILYSSYRRHNADQARTCRDMMEEAAESFGTTRFRIAVCGSGGRPIAGALGARYVQEVVSNAAAVRSLYPQTRTAVELGGQDAKIVFFYYDEASSRLIASDMRMNGSCAGGTGAVIDEVASLLGIHPEEFEDFASRGRIVHDISGRCGVFAKTDIQPLLIQGAAREDIALSTFHALAKQTIGGLSQGLELTPPIIFEGGPLTFNPTLIRVFAQRLGLKEEDIVYPEHPETLVACGAAIAVDELFPIEDEECESRSLPEALDMLNRGCSSGPAPAARSIAPFFSSNEERDAFVLRHELPHSYVQNTHPGKILRVYVGIDSGSTTSKIALIDERENVLDLFYSGNRGDPLRVVRDGFISIVENYRERGVRLEILGLGTTGYGERLFACAFGADYHMVETVAHAEGCRKFFPDVSFILDLGGQDMKAIWLRDGVVTDITLNEACSSGCGSFLENFAAALGIPVHRIAEAAFRSRSPALLGSRCTVFMNSTIINEQKNGRAADDLMAGLCRSIVENVFTKVVRISNPSELGSRIVVQGGTFNNLAVLRALEEYLGVEVVRAPYPGEMGALGAAIATKRYMETRGEVGFSSSFIGLDAVAGLSFTKEEGLRCPHCANHCSRIVMTFNTGARWVTGNRCERGAVVDAVQDRPTRKHGADRRVSRPIPDMVRRREELLFENYPCTPAAAGKSQTIGLPRVLEFWDSMPFWTTFFRSLGYETRVSDPSSQGLYESGLKFVASDTICFPAKLVHGHILDLAKKGVDRIFMPFVMHMPPEGLDKLSPYVCPVIMGYPMVVRNFESPHNRFGIPFDTPVFHWFTERDRRRQVCAYAIRELGVSRAEADRAFAQAEAAIKAFRARLLNEGLRIIDDVRARGDFAVVLAGRPYHNDRLVHHGINSLFTKAGIPVLTVDSLLGLNEVNLRNTRAEVTNVFHTRMLAAAVIAASAPELEYVQIVSFGCGHDAVLSDEISRILAEMSGKSPLILKVDESEASGSLGIRVQSFIETVRVRRGRKAWSGWRRSLPDPYTTKFFKHERKSRTVIIPNISVPVSKILSAVLEKGGFKAKTLPIGNIDQVRLGKKYTHNDICFPCQMVIGEALSELKSGGYGRGEAAVAMVKFQCDCRMSQYSGLLRKALDSAGFEDVAILTTDFNNTKNLHPGLSIFGLSTLIDAIWGCMMMDILDDLRRAIRPYEIASGEANRLFGECIERIAAALRGGLPGAVAAFRASIDAFCGIPYERSVQKPRVFVTGEILVTFHPGTNFHVEDYLVANGMEAVFPRVTDQLRKDFLAAIGEIRDFKAKLSKANYLADRLFDLAQESLEKIARKHPLFHPAARPRDLYEEVRGVIPETLSCGEGWLIAAEIVHHAARGVTSFIVLQPFGCLPNHVCGRGISRRIKDMFPAIQILPLDLDPDTSFANVENRLQMLIINERSHRSRAPIGGSLVEAPRPEQVRR